MRIFSIAGLASSALAGNAILSTRLTSDEYSASDHGLLFEFYDGASLVKSETVHWTDFTQDDQQHEFTALNAWDTVTITLQGDDGLNFDIFRLSSQDYEADLVDEFTCGSVWFDEDDGYDNACYQETTSISHTIVLYDRALKYLADLEVEANHEFDEAFGEDSQTEDWRIEVMRIGMRICKQMKKDYKNRRDNHECSPHTEMYEKEEDYRDLPEDCKESGKGLQLLFRGLMKWSRTFNNAEYCGTGVKPQKHRRIVKRLKAMRSKGYDKVPCNDAKHPWSPNPDGESILNAPGRQ